MPNKTRLEPINAQNNKHIKITYIYIYINITINELQSVVQSSSFDK